MIEREKVIKGLELCTERFCDSECPYYRRSPMIGGACVTALQADALALLKEQEALAVDEGKVNKCACGNEINRYWHPEYCGFCGKKLEWH